MDLYLVRHALAEPRDSDRWPGDFLRPLTPVGIRVFRGVAHGLSKLGIEVDDVLSSRYARAWTTAEILQCEAHWPAPVACTALEPGSQVSAAVEATGALASSAVALVGHEPQLSMLASLLLSGDENRISLKLRKGGIVHLRVTSPMRSGEAELRWSVTPKVLQQIAN